MRKVAIMIGSDSDLPQCRSGLEYLTKAQSEGLVEVPYIITSSIHRHTLETLHRVSRLAAEEEGIDVLIAGAGRANHLTGMCDSYLRYTLHNQHLVVVGVAFEDKTNPKRTEVAVVSITEVPGTQAVFDNFVGEEGFLKACQFAVEGELPQIEYRSAPPRVERTLERALEVLSGR